MAANARILHGNVVRRVDNPKNISFKTVLHELIKASVGTEVFESPVLGLLL
jgi:hypothetical protein